MASPKGFFERLTRASGWGACVRLVVAMTGASGVVYCKRLLEVLREKDIEIHLIISATAKRVIKEELGFAEMEIQDLADYTYQADDWNAPLVSGSFKTDGMLVVPCSMKTLSGIAHGYSENIILRAADVTLKEKRRLILVPRETPLNSIHLRNMLELAKQEVCIAPAMPAFYHRPKTIGDLVDFVVGRILDILQIEHALYKRWRETSTP